ncbi:hypothetical protein EMA8858_04141 [Emticicia aquatica]|uniref:Uncharacterized protein n=1 Tax=Emticicia aquatica TaxID=1681835 RepID=A0ABM9AVJ2_9BACT|nr:hypothetical protein [Emticicia aquatica]CAH0998006.1 hypothetical protein EMA8858_04141 [Emticicia aquatica]
MIILEVLPDLKEMMIVCLCILFLVALLLLYFLVKLGSKLFSQSRTTTTIITFTLSICTFILGTG